MIGAFIAARKLRSGFAAVARGDLETIVSVFRDDAVLIYPTVGSIKGKAAIREFYDHFLQTFPQTKADVHNICVQNIFDFVGTNVIATHWDVFTTNRRGITFQQTGIQLIHTKFGKVTFMRYFFADLDNLRRAWKESE